jgi:transposase-like protein
MRGGLSCERCGSIEVRRHPKINWKAHARWMCRSCIIVFELVEHTRVRMRFEQHYARHYAHLRRRHSSENIKDNLASARSRASKRRLPSTLMMDGWQCITAFFEDVCAFCGDKWEEIEHATPLCRGGGTTIANCLPTCKDCNGKKHQHTLEDLLAKDLWPHRTERLERALSWLQLHGRTENNPSGCPSQLSLEVTALIKLRERERSTVKPWFGPNVWFGLGANVVTSLSRRGIIVASTFDYRGLMAPYVMKGPCWKIHLTETGRQIEILRLAGPET